MLVLDGIVGEQHARCVGGNENEDVPKCMQIREIDAPPRVAEELVGDPADEGDDQNQCTANAQTKDAAAAFTVQTWVSGQYTYM